MGQFVYGSAPVLVDFDDRVLAHLRVVIASKLRRSESFLFTWEYSSAKGSGHSSVWLHPAIPLQFIFTDEKEPAVNRQWLEDLVRSSNSPGGLRVVPEPPEPTPPAAPKVTRPRP